MENQLLHTPEGVRDIYGGECAKKLAVQKQIQKQFHLYGYENIETPTFEFFDIFNKERGSVRSTEMFKFFDRNNNTLVLRPDMTPAIARCVAKYFMDVNVPIRLCYLERTFINNSSYQGRLKEVTQTGAELIGDDSFAADAEMVALVIRSLLAAGLKEFQVELGQAEFFRGLAEEADMDQETQETLRELIENKNDIGVEELILHQPMDDSLKQVFLRLPGLFGSIEQIKQVKEMTGNQRALKAIERLEDVHRQLTEYGLAGYVSYDLGMLSQYDYYTGIIFKAYTYGTGDYIVTGGRYDKLLVQFGKDAPAVGFAIVIDQLMLALTRQEIDISLPEAAEMIVYHPDVQHQAMMLAEDRRKDGRAVALLRKSPELSMEEYLEFGRKSGRQMIWCYEEEALICMRTDGKEERQS